MHETLSDSKKVKTGIAPDDPNRLDLVTRWTIWKLLRASKVRITLKEFKGIRERFKDDNSVGDYVSRTFLPRNVIDPEFVNAINAFRGEYGLKNFVETGTFDGDTSFFFSALFDRVFTCDVTDIPKRLEFYFRDNIVCEIMDSPAFLMKHLDEIKEKTFFFLDAHWGEYLPLRDELKIIFEHCVSPIILIDDFQAGEGLKYDTYNGHELSYSYITDLIPKGYDSRTNTRSYRQKGMIFLFPKPSGLSNRERTA